MSALDGGTRCSSRRRPMVTPTTSPRIRCGPLSTAKESRGQRRAIVPSRTSAVTQPSRYLQPSANDWKRCSPEVRMVVGNASTDLRAALGRSARCSPRVGHQGAGRLPDEAARAPARWPRPGVHPARMYRSHPPRRISPALPSSYDLSRHRRSSADRLTRGHP